MGEQLWQYRFGVRRVIELMMCNDMIRVFWQWYAVLRLAMGSILYLKRRRPITANGCHPNSCRPGLKAVLVIISDNCRYQMNATWLQPPLQQVAFIYFKFDCYVQVLIIVDLLIEPVLISHCNFTLQFYASLMPSNADNRCLTCRNFSGISASGMPSCTAQVPASSATW